MNTIQLEKQWDTIENKSDSELKYIRIDGVCIPELCLAVNGHNNRCLMLRLPINYKTTFIGEDKENIKTSYSKKGNYIILELLDNYYNLLFNDLIISLYYKIKDISDSNESTNTFISTINKWSSFLEKSKNSKLSKDIIKGIFGELIVLKEYLVKADTLSVDNFLKAWRGPYDDTTDFIFENSNVEVKTKSVSSPIVRISSEFQLDNEPGKSLILTVVSLESDSSSKTTIAMLFNEIRDLILQLNGDLSLLSDALAHKNLFPSNLTDYDEFKFNQIYMEVYDCDIKNSDMSFPRIKKSELPPEIGKVRYDLNLNSLTGFIIDKIEF
ncbi:PD-(D/E)XK motif protein [Gelidibacter japonicus]|jgi:hypothetical protein|uniref:PD-(D/E)XK motif protein n=1 Tax=Gelidibacter japonicus TaxID=1962232 RepID=UPI0020208DCD|nr:PD-(D/E)XK motif protein [Gelidibacter japonicus]MCL8007899.1 PD-(D/E)XK motif protein [Gelidibacter japonicus]